MTDEERQQLVKDLRDEASCWSVPQASVFLCGKAADEIERLVAEVRHLTRLTHEEQNGYTPDYIPIGGAGNGA
jgi:hypothetical protein